MSDKPTTDALTPIDLPERLEQARFYEANYRVRTGDIDQEMRLRLDGLSRYLQDIANDNIEATEFHTSDPYWIVRRTVIDVIRPISWPGDVTLQRWCGALSTRWTNMRVRVTSTHQTNRFNPEPREDGLIETEAFWINVNDKGLPTRLSDSAFDLLSQSAQEHRLKWKSMNTASAPETTDSDRNHVLRATDFDPFKHLNNAAYWAAVEDELLDHPDLVEGPHRAVIEYLRAIAPESTVTIKRERVSDQLRMWLIVEDKVAATVTITKRPPA
ncbi:acyl-ACP thioesterase domain-containing protein [Williamsia sp. 1135]|uniref:acyl-[acyl-carrier-protein] thioesterase n=1 Tax=Williamsia sp. 1135 TaxID=1889262 RepID=UPI000A10B0A6|nr:acyl-ACP thioesterase domain-containing protein [Williamsia sp. 1135]ORM32181.1 acyl-ACP thioesterase [Williamsia sp. 1135]